jgi:RPA family protein
LKKSAKKMAETQGRQIAYKVRISDIAGGSYVKEEGWQPNYILTASGLKVSRVNIIATVVSIEPGTPNNVIIIDDGTGTIGLRSFEERPTLQNLEIGDLILVIGRPREYNTEKYIVPEIAMKLKNEGWVKVRQKELSATSSASLPARNMAADAGNPNNHKEEPVEEVVVEKAVLAENPFQKIYRHIRELDKGDGADINELIRKSGLPNADELVKELLKDGEIFELKRGKLKILE